MGENVTQNPTVELTGMNLKNGRGCLKLRSANQQTPFSPPGYVIRAPQKYHFKWVPVSAFSKQVSFAIRIKQI